MNFGIRFHSYQDLCWQVFKALIFRFFTYEIERATPYPKACWEKKLNNSHKMLIRCSLKEFNKWRINLPRKAFHTSLSSFATKRQWLTLQNLPAEWTLHTKVKSRKHWPSCVSPRRLKLPEDRHSAPALKQRPLSGEPRNNPLLTSLGLICSHTLSKTTQLCVPVCCKSTNIPTSQGRHIMKFPECANGAVLRSPSRSHSLVSRCRVTRKHHHDRQIQIAPKWMRKSCRATQVSLLSQKLSLK